jgi:type III secretory pathway component EscV
MKSDDVKIGKNLNDHVWKHGIRNPPSKVTVSATKDDEGVVRVELEGESYVDFKVKDKVDQNQTFKEKLQNKVATAKTGTKAEEPVKDDKKTEEKSTAKKSDVKAEAAPAKEAPKKAEAKAEVKKEE